MTTISAITVDILGHELPLTVVVAVAIALVSIILLLFTGKKDSPIALDKDNYQAFPLIDIKNISHDVKRFRFGLPTPQHKLGLPIGQHISLKYVDEEKKEVIRSYTPTSSDDDLGYVDFVIKVYYTNTNPRFPDGGKMSQHLASLKLGDTILMRGPKGHLDYQGEGKFTITTLKKEVTSYQKKKIGMIAGGTGITPMLQVIRAILKNPQDKTQLWLIFANQTEEDILLREELEAIPSDRLHLYYTLDRPPAEGWKYGAGFINGAMCKEHLPPAGPDTMIFVCGPPPMIKFACEPAFKEIGITEKDWFAF